MTTPVWRSIASASNSTAIERSGSRSGSCRSRREARQKVSIRSASCKPRPAKIRSTNEPVAGVEEFSRHSLRISKAILDTSLLFIVKKEARYLFCRHQAPIRSIVCLFIQHQSGNARQTLTTFSVKNFLSRNRCKFPHK